ncbi:MAG TPA: hypothetical protein VKB03_03805 [Conexibacter sp.]|nr:hypothetical protein [Conexibacter sp.]
MRKALVSLLVAATLIGVSATVARAATVTISPSGNIVAAIGNLGFEGIVIPLFVCNVTLTGTLAAGPITLPGRVGSITGVRANECSGGHTVVANRLPWTLTGQTALVCPSASTGLLGTLPASITLDGALTGSGNIGLLLSSGSSSAVVLLSRLSNGVLILGAGGNYTQVQTIRCA